MSRDAPDAGGGPAEAERILERADAAADERRAILAGIDALREECSRLESEAAGLLRRVQLAGAQVGDASIVALARRQLGALEAEA